MGSALHVHVPVSVVLAISSLLVFAVVREL